MTAYECEVSLWRDENILELGMTDAKLCERTKI